MTWPVTGIPCGPCGPCGPTGPCGPIAPLVPLCIAMLVVFGLLHVVLSLGELLRH